jgi:hypothetical protein
VLVAAQWHKMTLRRVIIIAAAATTPLHLQRHTRALCVARDVLRVKVKSYYFCKSM